MRLPPLRTLKSLGVILPALGLSSLANAQNYSDLPPLTPMGDAQVRQLPAEYRTGPVVSEVTQTVTIVDGVETITRTRQIDRTAPSGHGEMRGHRARGHAPMAYAPPAYAPVVFDRNQWLDECYRRTAGRDKDESGVVIGGLLGAIAGGVAGYEIAGAGDRVLGTVLGVGGGGLIGGLIGSLFDGDDDDNRYDCEAALDNYLTQHGTPGARIASREIPYPAYAYGYPAAYGYGYAYAPPPQMVLVEVRTQVPQRAVMRETVREETYMVPGTAKEFPDAPPPSPKMIKRR